MIRPAQTTTPRPADLLLAVAFAGLTQTEVWVFTADDGFSAAVRVGASLFTLVASSALAFRRVRPGLSFLVNGLAVYGAILVGFPSDIYQWTNLVATYSIGAHGVEWQRWAGIAGGVSGVLFYFVRFPAEGGPALAAFAAAMWVVAWLAGRMYEARIEEAQLRRERDLSRRLAEANEERLVLEEERNRIARELHDIVGHTVNVMVVHAEAGRNEVGRNDHVATRAFETIARTGREALSELDRVLAVLRRDDAELAHHQTPGVGDLDRLAETFSDTGLAVDVDVSGKEVDVPASVGLAAYRIAQEALTNTLKHGSATRAWVEVAMEPGKLSLTVADDGIGRSSEIQAGRGILGMRERTAMHGGELSVGTDDEGRFTVAARLVWDPGQ
jgi:signal transduction histidine kinase